MGGDLYHCAGSSDQNHPQEKEMKKDEEMKSKLLSVEALQIAKKGREVKGKGERERYTQLKAEFQRNSTKR